MCSSHVCLFKQVGGGILGTHDRLFTKPINFKPMLLLLSTILPSTATATSAMSNKTLPTQDTPSTITMHGICWLFATLTLCVLGSFVLSAMPPPIEERYTSNPIKRAPNPLTHLTWLPGFFSQCLDVVESNEMIKQSTISLVFGFIIGYIILSWMPPPIKKNHAPNPFDYPLKSLICSTWFPSFFQCLDVVKTAQIIKHSNILLALAVGLCLWMWDTRKLLAEIFSCVLKPPDRWPGPVTCTCTYEGYSRR